MDPYLNHKIFLLTLGNQHSKGKRHHVRKYVAQEFCKELACLPSEQPACTSLSNCPENHACGHHLHKVDTSAARCVALRARIVCQLSVCITKCTLERTLAHHSQSANLLTQRILLMSEAHSHAPSVTPPHQKDSPDVPQPPPKRNTS